MHANQQDRGHHRHRHHQFEAELGPTRLRLIHLLLAQLIEQQSGVQAGTGTDRQGQTGVSQRTNQNEVEQLGNDQVKIAIFTGVRMFCCA
jgi:hypothetical protein